MKDDIFPFEDLEILADKFMEMDLENEEDLNDFLLSLNESENEE